MIVHLRFSTKA